MGRRRRKIVKLPKKKLPKIFSCPSCGEESINIQIIRDKNIAEVKCSKCGLKANIDVSPADQPIDIYCKFTDKVYTGSLVRE
jgi:transcription elongation factor Elf1